MQGITRLLLPVKARAAYYKHLERAQMDKSLDTLYIFLWRNGTRYL